MSGGQALAEMLKLGNVGRRTGHAYLESLGLKVPKKQPKRGRLWLTDGSRLRFAARAS